MPALSKFYGITIKMFLRQSEHNPPHIHAVYGEYLAMFDIKTGEMLEGDLPNKALALTKEWVLAHTAELQDIWNTQVFRTLSPLD
ncbi:MAG: DUF4160 domain-containing protein [Oscillospiraceae bacterium]|jgi:hypothetical protein|nr:DUF4160 domain-containing protein [Oscillospiraceae bacterium]